MTTLADLFAVELENQFKVREEKEGIPREDWLTAGGSAKRPEEDAAWWEDEGPGMVERWLAWRQAEGLKIWKTPTGRPAIELDFEVNLGNHVKTRGAIDRVMVSRDGSLGIVDLKSGNSTPDSPLQLAIYKASIEVQYDIAGAVKWGVFFKARADKQYTIDLARWNIPLVRNVLHEYAKLQPVQAYPPRLGRHCEWCGVNAYCAAYGGKLASTADPTHPDFKES